MVNTVDTSEAKDDGGGRDLLDLVEEMKLPAPPKGTQLPSEALAELRADER